MQSRGFKHLPDYISDVFHPLYHEVSSYCELLDGVARLTHQSISLVDFFKGEILYISNNPLFLCGLTPKQVREMGPEINQRFVTPEENNYLIRVTRSWFQFIEKKPLEERKLYSLQVDYRLNQKPICVKMTPAFLSEEGKPWLLVCHATVSNRSECMPAIIFKYNSIIEWHYSDKTHKWTEKERILLKDIEEQILRLSIQGKKENEICQLIFRSKDGLKSIKRKLFQRMGVSNITEAVSFAISKGLI